MNKNLTRREILKLSSILPLAYLGPRVLGTPTGVTDNPKAQNILIIVFDSWSARNISLYGYQRDTTPNINRLAEKAVVYHNHYAAAPWTVPGTGSLLTGVYPWTHRGFRRGKVIDPFVTQNLFSEFYNNHYYTFGYSHNLFVDEFLTQFGSFEDHHLPIDSLYINRDPMHVELFENDPDVSLFSRRQILYNGDAVANSLFFSLILKKYHQSYNKSFYTRLKEPYLDLFPGGVPEIYGGLYYFFLEQGIDWLINNMSGLSRPFLGYFHFYPPHVPYTSRKEHYKTLDREWQPVKKPQHLFTLKHPIQEFGPRVDYDEYILYVDAEFGRLMDQLEESGQLDDTWIILTSDHGELFERGAFGHDTIFMFEPVVHIPLLIFEPGRNSRLDVYDRASVIDILPTMLHATGHQVPAWIEGRILPPFASSPLAERELFAIQPPHNNSNRKMREGTIVLYKENYKLIYYFGHEEIAGHDPYFELFDVDNDPEELNDLYPTHKTMAKELFDILKTNRDMADQPYKE